MFEAERDTLRVDVPVGFLLAEPREIAVSVERAVGAPLSIQLRLIPAQVEGTDAVEARLMPDSRPAPTHRPCSAWPVHSRARAADGDDFMNPDCGGGD